jgi:tetratricopeptide (TPR) repeat protein
MYNELSPAIVFREAGKYQAAQEWIIRFIETHPNDPEAFSLLSQVFLLDKKNAEAENALSKARLINSALPSIHRNQARLLLNQAKPEEALFVFNLGDGRPFNDPEDWLVIAACLGANQRDQEALALIKKILQVRPNYAEAFANRAVLRLRASDIVGAIKDAEMTVSIKPHLTQIWALLGHLRYQNKNLAGAIEAVKIANEFEPNNANHLINLGDFLMQAERFSEASSYLELASELVPGNADVWTNLGTAFQQSQKNENAKVAYKKSLVINPQSAEIWSNLGTMAGDSNDWESALHDFEQALAVNPYIAQVHDNIGTAQKNLGKLDDAVASYNKAIALDPNFSKAFNNLGVTLQALSRLEQAEASYRQAIAMKPDYADAHSNLGNVLKELSNPEQAEASYRQAIALMPDCAEVHSNLGLTLKELGKLEQAVASYRQAITLKPDYAEVHNNLGITLQELGRMKQAKVSYSRALELIPDYVEVHNNLAITINQHGSALEAESHLRQAIAIKPGFARGHLNLGILLYERGKYKEAAEQFRLADFENSESYLLRCFYLLDQQSNFYEQVDYLQNQGVNNAVIGSLISRAEIRYGIHKPNPFCNLPLEYFLKTDLTEQCDFQTIFVKGANEILNDQNVQHKSQSLLTNGIQTSGNVFNQGGAITEQIQKIIYSELEKYRLHYKDSEEGLITNWPTDYSIKGWLVSMKSGGELAAHMHDAGWISGSIYINVPKKAKAQSGNLVVCLDDDKSHIDGNKNKKSIDVVTGSLCLFPSSLLHYTIPFESEEDRIVLAFDVIPIN